MFSPIRSEIPDSQFIIVIVFGGLFSGIIAGGVAYGLFASLTRPEKRYWQFVSSLDRLRALHSESFSARMIPSRRS
jgi:hypothetical protein